MRCVVFGDGRLLRPTPAQNALGVPGTTAGDAAMCGRIACRALISTVSAKLSHAYDPRVPESLYPRQSRPAGWAIGLTRAHCALYHYFYYHHHTTTDLPLLRSYATAYFYYCLHITSRSWVCNGMTTARPCSPCLSSLHGGRPVQSLLLHYATMHGVLAQPLAPKNLFSTADLHTRGISLVTATVNAIIPPCVHTRY